MYGGERGIRTLDRGLTYTPLAGERLQPLGHLSGNAIVAHSAGALSTDLVGDSSILIASYLALNVIKRSGRSVNTPATPIAFSRCASCSWFTVYTKTGNPASLHCFMTGAFAIRLDRLIQLAPSLVAVSSMLPRGRSKSGASGVVSSHFRNAASSS